MTAIYGSLNTLLGEQRMTSSERFLITAMPRRPRCHNATKAAATHQAANGQPDQAATVFSDTIFVWIWGGTTSYFSSCMLNWARPARTHDNPA